ncbi:MAG: glycosyltransferase family 4 protein [Saprospiraceae bacterium]|nr:glycosyltransferase family 4 protein [Saprospiraceae bacterium]
MKIAVNTRFLIKSQMEGMGRFSLEVLKRMVTKHPEHEFYFLFDRPYDEDFVFAKNVHPIVVAPPARHPVLFYLWFEWRVPAVLKKIKADVFVSMDNFCSLKAKIPTLLIIHDLAYLHFPEQIQKKDLWFYRYYTPKYIQKADRIVTVSAFTKQDLLENFPVNPEKVDVACNGCSTNFRPLNPESVDYIRREVSNGKPYFIYVGAIHPRKNVGRLIMAFNRYKKQTGASTKLLIIGRKAWMTKEAQKAFKESAWKNDILFKGFVPREKLPVYIGAALAMVYVSLFEGFGIPILEAMHAEVPVITSNVSSMPEVAGEAGLLVDPYDVESITEAMILIEEDVELRLELVKKGRQQRQNFTWNKASDIVFNNIMQLKGKRS